MRKVNKKRIYAVIAGFMAIVMICLGVLWDASDVVARDTLEGIKMVVADNKDTNPYKILQIVPDVAKATVSDGKLVSGNTVEQSMGTIGYYIGGSEPVQLEKDLVQYAGSAARKEYVDRLFSVDSATGATTGVLAPITDVSANSVTKPLSFSAYAEVYESNLTPEEIDAGLLSETLHELNYSAASANHIEQITGAVMTQDSSISGNFIKTYIPAATADEAVAFFNGTKGKFTKGNTGSFDPGFRAKKGEDSVVYNAVFQAANGRTGYVVSGTEEIMAGMEVIEHVDYFDGKAVYKMNNGVYEYVGRATVSDNKVDVQDADGNWLINGGSNLLGRSLRSAAPSVSVSTVKSNVSVKEPTVSANETSNVTDKTNTATDKTNTATGGTSVSPNEVKTSNGGAEKSAQPTPTVSNGNASETSTSTTSTTSTTTTTTETVESPTFQSVGAIEGSASEISATVSGSQVSENTVSGGQPQENTVSGGQTSEAPMMLSRSLGAGANTTYVILSFSYTEQADEGVQVYSVKEFDTATNGIYAIDEARPLVPNMAGTGTIIVDSNFEATNPERFAYRFLRGAGNYQMNVDPFSTTSVCRIIGMRVFYMGGFTNNEWFRKSVFDRDAGEQCDNFYMEVSVKPVNEVTVDDISNSDFVYLSNPDLSLLPYGADSVSHTYGESTSPSLYDFDLTVGMRLLKRVVEDKLPVIVDNSILTSNQATVSGSNVYRLANALRLEDLESFYAAYTDTFGDDLQDAFDHINDTQTISENHYVRENRYSYALSLSETKAGGTTDILPLLNAYFDAEFSEDTVANRFLEVLDDIRNENLYRETDGNKEPLSEKISEATAIRYIINYAQKRVQVEKASIRVLEIQPCNSYDLSVTNVEYQEGTRTKNEGTLYYKRGKAGDKTIVKQNDTKIELTQMTTAEFVGKTEDINEKYDMIYIGLNTGLMNTDKSGKTVYNDTTMNGMVYTNVGDYVYVQPAIAGMLDTDYIDNDRGKNLKGSSFVTKGGTQSRYRYAGNDITEEKRKAIEDFISAGYPVVIEDDMMQVDTATGEKKANAAILDNSSYMYELIEHAKDKKNLIRLSNLTESLFNWYLNLEKPNITIIGTAADAEKETLLLSKSADGFYWLTYQFTLTNKSAADTDTTCDCKLYVDINADGKFSKTNERVSDITITNSSGETQHPDDGGKYSLAMNKEYYVRRAVSDEYAGVIPWKLEVTQRGNSARRAGATGYYEIKRPEKEKIKILQIRTAGGNNNLDLAASMLDTKSMFYHYITQLDTFDITFTSINANEYKTAHDKYYEAEGYKGGSDYLDQYDMLIIGFADVYREADNSTGAMTAISEYVKAGRSILFTHDTTSFVNVPSGQFVAEETDGDTHNLTKDGNGYNKMTHWGYSFNTLIRGLVGMDRYGIKGVNKEILQQGKGFDKGSQEWSDLTDKSKNGEKDVAYVPGSARTQLCPEVQGYNYANLNRLVYNSNYATYLNLKGMPRKSSGQYDGGNNVTRVNSGQITTYPYTLDEVFPVAQTHAQYYQLDLVADDDNDGESDIVVWYTIDDQGIKRSGDIYQFSPRDVRNNYYIFNKGNITYSGVGHKTIEKTYSATEDANEVKLFINTMIAAYRAGLRAPRISILENEDYASRRIDNIYLSYDKMYEDYLESQNPGLEPLIDGVLEATEDIYFTADNVSFVEGAQILTARYFYASDDADAISLTINGQTEPVKVKEMTSVCPLYRAVDNVAMPQTTTADGSVAYEIDGSKVYKFSIPTGILPPGAASENVYVQVTATLRNANSGRVQSITGTKAVKLVRTQLFNLD